MRGPTIVVRGSVVQFRHVFRTEWRDAWHYARYGRRHNSTQDHIGHLLRQTTRCVMHQARDPLAVRAAMQGHCHPLSAVIATHQEFLATIRAS